MLPPVRITRTEILDAFRRIAGRHRDAGCCAPSDLPSARVPTPRTLLVDLRKHGDRFESWISRADALDAQLLVIASSWDRWRTEHHHIRGALAHGLFHDQVGDALGIGRHSSRRSDTDPRPERRRRTGRGDPHQPARARLRTLSDLLRYDEPDVDLTRTARRERAIDAEDPRTTWLLEHHDELRAVTNDLATAATKHGVDDPTWLGELAADVDDDVITSATTALLGLAIAEIRTARSVISLTTTHNVHRALLAADRLRCRYSGVGCHAHWQSAPPPQDVAQLVREIGRRREHLDDSRRDQLPAPESADPAEVLRFLHRAPATNRAARAFDHLAGIRLSNALWWQDRNAELAALHHGLRVCNPRDVLRRQIGASYAITQGQGVQDRVDRLTSLSTRGRPDEKQARDVRASNRSKLRKEHRWIAEQHGALHRIAGELIAAADELQLPDSSREWVDLLHQEYREDDFSVDSLVTFAYAADEIHEAVDADDWGQEHRRLHDLLAEVDRFPAVKRLREAARIGMGDITDLSMR